MRKTAFKYLQVSFPLQYHRFMKLVEQWEKDTGDPRSEFALEKYVFTSSFGPDVPKDVLVAEHITSGPREPALIWSGSRWFSSEDDLSSEEEELASKIAAHCPGGLAGFS